MLYLKYTMDQNRVFIMQTLNKLLPSSIIGEVTCFVFYDGHPRDERSLDVTVCTKSGEVLEYYQHEIISSIRIETATEVTNIEILRNSKCELFYLLAAKDEIVILSTKDKLQIHSKVSDVGSYTFEDLECTGQACLKIIRSDDAVPLVFDDDFASITETKSVAENPTVSTHTQIGLINIKSEESLPIVQQLMIKLTEAKYTVRHNEIKLNEYVQMRQAAAFSIYQKATFQLDNAFSKLSVNEVSNLLQVTVKHPVVKFCNKKVIIIISLKNNNLMIKDVCVLLLREIKRSIEYTTKVFENILKPPHWKETVAQVTSYNEATVVAVVNLEELQFDEASRIDFEISLSFTKSGKPHVLPLKSVSISPMDVMGDSFDILLCGDVDIKCLLLCIMSTSECYDLCLKRITNFDDNSVTLSDIFHKHLKMEKYQENVAICKVAPFHKLYGVTVVFEDNNEDTNIMCVKVYTRCPSQVLALLHYMYEVVPYRIVVTTPDYKISEVNNDISNENEREIDYTSCASSIMNQVKLINEYIEACTSKMSESSSANVSDKVGTEVDLMALGVPKYLEFRQKILEESLKGIKSLSFKATSSSDSDTDCMIIDD